MSFLWPGMLLLLLLLPGFVALYVRLYRRRRQIMAHFGNLGLAAQTQLSVRRYIPPTLFIIALAILIVALARPQAVLSLPHVEGTVILAFDVSGSMAADDFKPTRMDAAKAAAQDFVQREPRTVQIGVVAFSDSGFSVQAPTNEQEAVLAAINRLTPQRGTSLANGILVSLKTIESQGQETTNYYSNITPEPTLTPTPVPQGAYIPAVIVLLTDGENNESPDPLAAVQAAVDRGVRIYTVGIGSPAGTTLHINGFTVHTQLDEATLQKIAQMSGGAYYNADNDQDLRSIYDNLSSQLVVKPEQTEITALVAGVALFFLLTGGTLSLLWFGRIP